MPPRPGLHVAAVQYRARKGALAASRAELVALARQAAEGADLVVLPEMAVTGYVFPDAAAVAAVAETPGGPTAEAFAEVAAAERCWLVVGFPERDGDQLYNSALVLDPAGACAFVYRKTLLFDEDLHWATPGNSGYRVFGEPGRRFGVGICMDLNDARFVDWLHGQELAAVAFPTNWLQDETGIDLHTYWFWRLGRSGAALVAANTWGADGHVAFSGRSAILQRGRVLSSLPPAGHGIVRAVLPST